MGRAGRARTHNRRWLHIEQLEDRRLLAIANDIHASLDGGIAQLAESLSELAIEHRSTTLLSANGVSGISELSGVTYLGESGGLHRFAAAKDNGSGLVLFDVAFSANGSIVSATAVSNRSLDDDLSTHDYEGVAFTNSDRNSVFVAEERTPDVSEYSLASGNLLQTVSLPDVFDADNFHNANLGLESLTRSPAGDVMWTSTQASLTVDGPVASTTEGTTVRLQRFDVDGNTVTAGTQFAYVVEPIHSTDDPNESGLSDLVMLPDGSLITLERSRAGSPTENFSSIFLVDFSGATDISQPEFDGGLIGESYQPVAKTLLWSGYVDGGFGLNMEGLALGPDLGDNNWALLGVVDNGGGTNNNYLVSFELTIQPTILVGDYNGDGRVSAADFSVWRDHVGAPSLLNRDPANDGPVGDDDLDSWIENYGNETSGSGAGAAAAESTESSARNEEIADFGFQIAELGNVEFRMTNDDLGSGGRVFTNNRALAAESTKSLDELLLVSLSTCDGEASQAASDNFSAHTDGQDGAIDESFNDAFDQAFELFGA